LNRLPLLLTALRAALGPLVLLLAYVHPDPAAFGAALVAAFASDYFDGVLARRLGVATAGLRRLDSLADTIFYVSAALAAWHLTPGPLAARGPALLVLASLEFIRYLVDLRKFGREASYHMWSSKAWGVALFAGFYALLALRIDSWAVDAAVYVGIIADLEGLAISIVLPTWKNDVPTILLALRIRESARRRGPDAPGRDASSAGSR